MTPVHPRFVGNRATVLVNYHGSDTYRFSSDKIDPVESVDSFGYRKRYTTLTRALQSFFADENTSLLQIVALWLWADSIELWEAQHIARRLRLEGEEGFGENELDITKLELLPASLKAKGVEFLS